MSGGYKGGELSSAEAVILDPTGNLSCPPIPDLPHAFSYGAAFTVDSDIPVVLGGSWDEIQCFALRKKMTAENETELAWEAFDNLTTVRRGAAHAQIGEDFWMAGELYSAKEW